MKKGILLLFFAFWSVLISAQSMSEKTVVRFMGIPVDGTKSEMISKLKKKGFTYDYKNDVMYGEFNGSDVMLFFHLNKDKVWRIAVLDKNLTSGESTVIRRFNRLLEQFENNEKYTTLFETNEQIKADEDISYEMMVNNKRYEAYFHQKMDEEKVLSCWEDTVYMRKWKEDTFAESELDSLRDISKSEDEFIERITNTFFITHNFECILHNTVWFSIYESYGQYGILLFYENGYNESKGEDL